MSNSVAANQRAAVYGDDKMMYSWSTALYPQLSALLIDSDLRLASCAALLLQVQGEQCWTDT
jgi:hypothetical protein